MQRTPRPKATGFTDTCTSGSTNTCPSIAALQRTTFVFAQASPHTVVLAGLKRPLKALFANITTAAYDFRLFDLQDGGTRVADGEEELRVLIEAGRTITQIPGALPPHT